MQNSVGEVVRDIVSFTGLGMVIIGAWRISSNAGLIAVGSVLFMGAVFFFRKLPHQG